MKEVNSKMYLLYQIALLGLFLCMLPGVLWAGHKTGKYRRSLRQRLGGLPRDLRLKLAGGRWIWVHAVSVGETAAVAPLVTALKEHYPAHKILLSTVTETGQEMARKNLPCLDAHIFFPLDFDFVLKKVLDAVNPELVVLAETELWPNFLRHLKKRSLPVVLVNGRISEKSFKHYNLVNPLMGKVLANINHFSMQTAQDKERIVALGAPPELVEVNGNLKFERHQPLLDAEERKALRDAFRLPAAAPLLVAGSTHPGEEEIVLRAFHAARQKHQDLFLVLAPRHPERLGQVEQLIRKGKTPYVRKTELAAGKAPLRPIVLLDTIGELASVYSLASVVFVGGSMVPVGGHNILEPAVYAKAVVFGPHMHNFSELSRLFRAKKAALQVKDGDELGRAFEELLSDAHRRARMGQAALKVVEENQGATERTLALLDRYLPPRRAA